MRSSARGFDGRAGVVAAKVMARANRQAEAEAVVELAPAGDHLVLVVGFGPGTSVTFSVQKIVAGDRRDLPQACTLGPTDGSERRRRWQSLHETAAPTVRFASGELQVRYPPGPGVREELRDLAAAEQLCCSFVTWEVVEHAGHPVLRVTGPAESPDEVEAIAAMFGAAGPPP